MDSSTGSQSQHYSNLLSVVSDLKSGLERANAQIQSTQEQNSILKDDYKSIKEELIETRRKFNEISEKYVQSVNDKFDAERKWEADLDLIKLQLDEKIKEFEQLRDKKIPRDLADIKMLVQEELEKPHRESLQIMRHELEKYEEMYYDIVRQLKRSKIEFAVYVDNQNKLLEAERLNNQHFTERNREQVLIMQDQAQKFATEKDFEIRSLRMKVSELEVKKESVLSEISQVRRERDDLERSFIQLQTKEKENTLQLQAQITSIEADKLALDRRVALLKGEAEQNEILFKGARAAAEDLKDQVIVIQRQLVEKDNIIGNMKLEYSDQLARMNESFEKDAKNVREELKAANDQTEKRSDTIRKMQKELLEAQLKADTFDAEMRRYYTNQIQDLKLKLEQAEVSLRDERLQSKQTETTYQSSLAKKTDEMVHLQEAFDKLQREAVLLRDRLSGIERTAAEEKNSHMHALDDMRTKQGLMEGAMRGQRARIKGLEAELSVATAALAESKKDIIALESAEEEAKREQEIRWAEMQEEVKKKYQALETVYRDKLEQTVKSVRSSLAKERKRGDAYKEKALEAHRRNKAISGAMAAAVKESPFYSESKAEMS